jgi:hypothetical protein
MAKQFGSVRISGTLGDITYAKDGSVRMKSSLDGDRMRKDPSFKRTRENWAHFREAAFAAKKIRKAFGPWISDFRDKRAYPRLLVETLKVVKSDSQSNRGLKKFNLGDLSYLAGYNFNGANSFESSFPVKLSLGIDRTAGTAELKLPSFHAEKQVIAAYGATHFKLMFCGTIIDWEGDENAFEQVSAETPLTLIGEQIVPEQTLQLTYTPDTPHSILLATGLVFYQEDNGENYQLSDNSHQSLSLAAIDHI